PGVRAIFDALAFDGRPRKLENLSADDLAYADRALLTPLLARLELPPAAREHVDGVLKRNTIRCERIASAYEEFAGRFDHVVLKGFSHVPDFVQERRLRTQYDIDLYVRPPHATAWNTLLALGYEPIHGIERLAADHFPTLVRKTGWQWRGDFYDPDLPPSIEVHFQFWDEQTEKLHADGVEEFWMRREARGLALPDRLGYAALHLTRHLLRGNLRPLHIWELANFLNSHGDPEFWRTWRVLHSPNLRRIEAVAFLLAKTWFAPSMPEEPAREIAALPRKVHRWFDLYPWSPVEDLPNKHELWLHLSLLDSALDRAKVLRRRLIPAAIPGPVDAVHIPEEKMTRVRRVRRLARNVFYMLSRAAHHARVLIPTFWEGCRWTWRSRR
ncbi:MAG: nucleotidyltransferase family protein, partial [Bryobacteraceae bacterium]